MSSSNRSYPLRYRDTERDYPKKHLPITANKAATAAAPCMATQPPKPSPAANMLDSKHSSPHKPTGLLLLDWDGTIIKTRTKADPSRDFIAKHLTTDILSNAIAYGIDIHIVTAMPAVKNAYDLILRQLRQLNLINEKHNEAFWRQHIHCVLKNMAEQDAFEDGEIPDGKPIDQRKKTCVEGILSQPEYAHLTHIDVQFHDDNYDNCTAVSEIKIGGSPITVVDADEITWRHFPVMEKFVHSKKPPQKEVAKNDDNEHLIKKFREKLIACINIINAKNSGGHKEIRKILDNPNFKLIHVNEIHRVAVKRLAKTDCSTCCPTFFGGRAPGVQKLYSILNKLGVATHRENNMQQVNKELDDFRILLQTKSEPVAVALSRLTVG